MKKLRDFNRSLLFSMQRMQARGRSQPLLALLGAGGLLLVVVFIFIFASLRGREEVQIPTMIGDELTIAILKLQERNLVPHLRLRFDSNDENSGTVLQQIPSPGTNVRVGKRVTLEISRGSLAYAIDSFIGLSLEEVQQRIGEYESNYSAQLNISNISYVQNRAPSGTVIAQDPPAGTKVTNYSQLDLVISLGDAETGVVVPNVINSSANNAISLLTNRNIPFQFRVDEAALVDEFSDEPTILSQDPQPGLILEEGQGLTLTIAPPIALALDSLFTIYEYQPTQRASLQIELALPNGEVQLLAAWPEAPPLVSLPIVAPRSAIIRLLQDGETIEERLLDDIAQPSEKSEG